MSRHAFTLVELLMVVAIMALLLAMALAVPRADRRRIAVESAARELAGVLHQARGLAMERRACYAVAFNITNGGGTSGKVLNNWGGEHWYQIIGPAERSHMMVSLGFIHPEPRVNNPDFPLTRALDQIAGSWYGQRHALPARQVRFLALSDQDSGGVRKWWDTGTAIYRAFPPTYPRPWFGWWDPVSKRLHAWGGYDAARSGGVPVVRDAGNSNCSGFYYEGYMGPITDSRNPAGRTSSIDGRTLFAAGATRPLVNGAWLDSYIQFRPDGTATFGRFGILRIESYRERGNAYGGAATGRGDIGDMAPGFGFSDSTGIIDSYSEQASHWIDRTGRWYLTLAPDADADSDVFPTAEAAARSMLPAYRVAISPLGQISVLPVRPALPAGAVPDQSILPGQWQTTAITNGASGRYQRNQMTTATGAAQGRPVVDAIDPRLLAARCWWLQ